MGKLRGFLLLILFSGTVARQSIRLTTPRRLYTTETAPVTKMSKWTMLKTTIKVGFVGAIAYGSYGMFKSEIRRWKKSIGLLMAYM